MPVSWCVCVVVPFVQSACRYKAGDITDGFTVMLKGKCCIIHSQNMLQSNDHFKTVPWYYTLLSNLLCVILCGAVLP